MTAADYLAREIIDRAAFNDARRIIAGWIALVASQGVDLVAEREGWCWKCGSEGDLPGGYPCPECKGPTHDSDRGRA